MFEAPEQHLLGLADRELQEAPARVAEHVDEAIQPAPLALVLDVVLGLQTVRLRLLARPRLKSSHRLHGGVATTSPAGQLDPLVPSLVALSHDLPEEHPRAQLRELLQPLSQVGPEGVQLARPDSDDRGRRRLNLPLRHRISVQPEFAGDGGVGHAALAQDLDLTPLLHRDQPLLPPLRRLLGRTGAYGRPFGRHKRGVSRDPSLQVLGSTRSFLLVFSRSLLLVS